MKKHFYSHLIETDSLFVELDMLELSQEEKSHLVSLVHSSLHHAILDAVLSELSEEDKRDFLLYVHEDNHEKIWNHLNSKIEKIEDKITKAATDLKEELKKDIKEAKENK